MADEELGTSGVGIGGTSHRDNPTLVGLVVELGFDLIAGATSAGHTALAGLGVGATTLDHETLDDPVEGGAVIETFPGEFFEVRNRLGCDFGPESDSEIAVGGLDDGLFYS